MIGTRGLPATHGGVEQAVQALSVELAKRGHDITVYGRRGYCDAGLRSYEGVRQIVLPAVQQIYLEAVSHTTLATMHAITRERYDVVHFHATGPTLFSPLSRMRGVPTVATVQGLDYRREKWGPTATSVLRIAAKMAATVPTETIVVSEELKRIFAEHYGADVTFIPNGVDYAALDGPCSPVEGVTPGFVLFLGRIVPEKQVHVLVEAYRAMPDDKQLVIAGPTNYAQEYFETVKAAAQGDPRIRFVGPRYGAEKNWLLQQAGAFVQPSTIEGMPIALLEAMACGLPVIVSDIPENIETVTLNGAPHGLVFRVGDTNDLTRALRQQLDRGNGRDDETSRAVRSRYDWPAIAEQTETVYRRAVARKSRA